MPITSPPALATASSNPALVKVSVALFSTIFAVLVTFATWIWRHSTQLMDEDDHVQKQETAHRDQVAAVFADILVRSLRQQEIRTDGGHDQGYLEERIKAIILDADLDALIEALLEFGTPEALHDATLADYERAYKRIALSALGFISIPVVIVAVAASGDNPFSWTWDFVHGTLGVISACILFAGFTAFFRARDRELELKRR